MPSSAPLDSPAAESKTSAHHPPAAANQPGPGTVGETCSPAIAPTADPGTCPACAVTRWQWVATTTAAAGWRTVRNHLADLGEDTADSRAAHDCTRPAGPDLVDDSLWATGQDECRSDSRERFPLFCAIDRHGTPQTGYPLSTRTIIASRLAAAVCTITTPDPAPARPAWGSDDDARVVAARQAATDRLASFEAELDDAYAKAILERLDAALTGGQSSGPDERTDDLRTRRARP